MYSNPHKSIKAIALILLSYFCIITKNIAAIGILSVTGTNCTATTPTGEVQFVINGNAGPYNYTITNTQNTILKQGTIPNAQSVPIVCNGLAKGNYTISIQNSIMPSCRQTLNFTIDCCNTTNLLNFEVSIIPQSNGLSNVEVLSTVGGSTNKYYYHWTKTGDNTFHRSGAQLKAVTNGTYCLEVTDGTCAKKQQCFKVGDCPDSLITKSFVYGVCNGLALGGSIDIIESFNNGKPPYKYIWSNGIQGINSIAGLERGRYQVTVADANYCADIKSFEVKDRYEISAITTTNGCGDQKGSIDISVAPYYEKSSLKFLWKGKQTGFVSTSEDITNLEDDTYTLEVRADNCGGKVVLAPPPITISNSALDVSVNVTTPTAGTKGAFSFFIFGKPPLAYTFNNEPLRYADRGNIDDLEEGSYTLTVRNGDGCIKTVNIDIMSCEKLLSDDGIKIASKIIAECPFNATFEHNIPFYDGITTTIKKFEFQKRLHKNGIDSVVLSNKAEIDILVTKDVFCDQPYRTLLAHEEIAPQCNFETYISGLCGTKKLDIITDTHFTNCSPITYEWEHTNANTASVILPAALKTTSVTVTDANGCSQTKTFDFDIKKYIEVSNLCEGDGKICVNLRSTEANIGGPFEIKSYPSNGSVKSNVGDYLCGLSGGDNLLHIKDLTTGCAYDTLINIIPVASSLEVNYSVKPAQTNTSNEGEITLSISTTNNYAYLLTNFKDFSVSDKDVSNAQLRFTNLTPGWYYLSIYDNPTCVKTYRIYVYFCNYIFTASNLELIVNDISLEGEVKIVSCQQSDINCTFRYNAQNQTVNVTVNAKTAVTCMLSSQQRTMYSNSLSVFPSQLTIPLSVAGNYYFTVLAGDCRKSYKLSLQNVEYDPTIIDISENFLISEANIKHINAFCKVGKINLLPFIGEKNENLEYAWSGPNQFVSNQKNLDNLKSAGTYTLTITDPICNKQVTHAYVLKADPSLDITYTTNPICPPSNSTCVKFSQPAIFYKWTYDNGNGEKIGKSNEICGLSAGTYAITMTNEDSCSIVKTVEIKSSANFKIKLDATTVNASSCATSDGNLIIKSLTTTGGVAPITYEWFLGNKLLGVGNKPAFLYALAAGDYKLVATDANLCKTNTTFSIKANSSLQVDFMDIKQPCVGSANGQITASISPQLIGGYTFRWLYPINVVEQGVASSTQQNLRASVYRLQVYRTIDSLCFKEVSYDLSTQGPISSNMVTAEIKNACKGKTNGQVKIIHPSTLTMRWPDPIKEGFKRNDVQFDLAPGIYAITLTDQCGATAIKNVEVKEVGDFISKTIIDSKCRTDITGEFINATRPFKYRWDDGSTTDTLTRNATLLLDSIKYASSHFTVTVTDANRCQAVISVPPSQTWTISVGKACSGVASGELSASIYNPEQKQIGVKIGGVPQSLIADNYNYPQYKDWYKTQYNVKQLSVGAIIPVEIKIGNCSTTEFVRIDTFKRQREFIGAVLKGDSTEVGRCDYKYVCNGQDIKDQNGNLITYSEPGYYSIKNCQGQLNCKSLWGNNPPVYEQKIGKSFIRYSDMGEFLSFLKKEAEVNPDPAKRMLAEAVYKSRFQEVKDKEDFYLWCLQTVITERDQCLVRDSINGISKDVSQCDTLLKRQDKCNVPRGLCEGIKWCPEDYTIREWSNTITVGFTFSVKVNEGAPKKTADNCYEYKCGVNLKKVCPTSFSGIQTPPDVTVYNCDPKVESVAQLYWYYDQLLKKPRFKGSELDIFLQKNENNPKAKCADILYCNYDFTIKTYPDFNKIDCSSPKYCIENPDNVLLINSYNIFCNVNNILRTIWVTPNAKYPYRPANTGINTVADAAERGGTDYIKYSILYSPQKSLFKEFAEVTYGGTKGFNGIYKSDNQNFYFNFDKHKRECSIDNINHVEFDITDIDKSEQVQIQGVNKYRLYALSYDKENGAFWQKYIQADSLHIQKVNKYSSYIKVAGFHYGKLYYDRNHLYTASTMSAFIFTIDYEGNMIDRQFLDNIEVNNSSFVEYEDDYCFVGTNYDGNIKIDGHEIENVSEIGNYVFQYNCKTQNSNIIPIGTNLQIIKSKIDATLNYTYFLVSKKVQSYVDAEVDNMAIKKNEIFLMAMDENKAFIWNKKILMQGDINPELIDLCIDNIKHQIYIGVTFDQGITVDNKHEYIPYGSSDILIISLASNGQILNIKQLGTTENETVRRMVKVNDDLIFGGELQGEEVVKVIGETTFIKNPGISSAAYMAYLPDEVYTTTNSKSLTTSTENSNTEFKISVVPNPFSDRLYVNIISDRGISYEGRLIDILGRTQWSSNSVINNTGFEINDISKLAKGVYFIEIKNNKGQKVVKKLIKQ